jgi:pimeloyl-ACP methyl ester carboxylesterase
MFDTLIPLLADRYHIVALGHPGFRRSNAPPPSAFAHAYDHLAQAVDSATEALNLDDCVLYVQDYDGPIGFRRALADPGQLKVLAKDHLGPL